MERIGTEQKMTVREVAEALGYEKDYLRKVVKEACPEAVQNGIETLLTEEQVVRIKERLTPRTLDLKVQGQNAVTELEKQETIVKAKTMDSREIAELTGKQHAHVCRDIQIMLSGLEINQSNFGSVYTAGNGEERKCYKLPYRETMILVSGYSVELRARVIDRWMELEQKERSALPKSFAEALRLAADQAEALEQAQSQLAITAPKAEIYDAFIDSAGLYTIKEAAEMLNLPDFGGRELFRLLRLEEIFTQTNKPCVRYQREGLFVLKASAGGTGSRAMVTPKGIEFIRELVRESGLVLCARREGALCNDDGFIVGLRGAGRGME
jgi:phage regulator Rha-like protein